MNDILSHTSALKGCNGQRKIWANEMNFGMNHAPGTGLITQPADPACYHGDMAAFHTASL